MWIEYNNNPVGRRNVGDCSIRAVSVALNTTWEDAYNMLADNGFKMGDVMNGNTVISATLRQHGFYRHSLPNTCPDCYTIRDFCHDHPRGVHVVGTGTHVVAVIDGNYLDTFDSGDEVAIYYWSKKV